MWASLAGTTIPAVGPTPGYADDAAWDPVVVPDGVGIKMATGRSIEYGMDPIGTGGAQSIEWSLWIDPQAGGVTATAVLLSGFVAGPGHRGPYVRLAYDAGAGGGR